MADMLHSGRAQYVFADQPFSYVDPILRRLATEAMPPPMLQRLAAILEDLGQLHDRRHRVVQGFLTTQATQAQRAATGLPLPSAGRTTRGAIQFPDAQPNPEDLAGLTVGFQSSHNALLALHADWLAFELASHDS